MYEPSALTSPPPGIRNPTTAAIATATTAATPGTTAAMATTTAISMTTITVPGTPNREFLTSLLIFQICQGRLQTSKLLLVGGFNIQLFVNM